MNDGRSWTRRYQRAIDTGGTRNLRQVMRRRQRRGRVRRLDRAQFSRTKRSYIFQLDSTTYTALTINRSNFKGMSRFRLRRINLILLLLLASKNAPNSGSGFLLFQSLVVGLKTLLDECSGRRRRWQVVLQHPTERGCSRWDFLKDSMKRHGSGDMSRRRLTARSVQCGGNGSSMYQH